MPRKIDFTKEFKEKGTFQSMHVAEKWLSKNGYSSGSTCINSPVAIRKGEYDLPQKWHNLSALGKKSVDGIMTSSDWREGVVVVTIYK
jgi:hypothetical protein